MDGVIVATVDLDSSVGDVQYGQLMGELGAGTHTVPIRMLGTHNPNSTGNRVVFDGYSVP